MSKVSTVVGHFGRLWGRGHENLTPDLRRILSISGKGATTYLQGLVTCDLLTEPTPPRPEPMEDKKPGIPDRFQNELKDYTDLPPIEFSSKLRSACFLDNKGRIMSDALLWKTNEEQYFIDAPGDTADELLTHLKKFKLRRTKVDIEDMSDHMTTHVVFGTLNASAEPPNGYLTAMDPRHPSLGMRVLTLPQDEERSVQDRNEEFAGFMSSTFPESKGNYELVRRLVGVAEGKEIQGKVALETNQEFLNAVSFHKGCYLGQELTARVQHVGAIRKRIMPVLLLGKNSEVPRPWNVASQLQEGRVLKRFEKQELDHLPSKLPRISVLAAGNLVGLLTASIAPVIPEHETEAKSELQQLEMEGQQLTQELQDNAKRGSKIVCLKEGKTIGQIISAPVMGTNVVLAMMKLESVGLFGDNVWDRTNRVRVGDDGKELRFLPYLPLWWPEIDETNGKAKVEAKEEADLDEEFWIEDEDETEPETESSTSTDSERSKT